MTTRQCHLPSPIHIWAKQFQLPMHSQINLRDVQGRRSSSPMDTDVAINNILHYKCAFVKLVKKQMNALESRTKEEMEETKW